MRNKSCRSYWGPNMPPFSTRSWPIPQSAGYRLNALRLRCTSLCHVHACVCEYVYVVCHWVAYTNYLLSSGTNVFIYCRFHQTVKSSVMFLVALGPRVTYYAVTPFDSLLQLCDVQLCINTIRLILSVLWRRSLYASQIVWFIYLSRGWRGVSINIFKIFSPKFIHWVKWKKLCTDSRLVNIQIFTITNRRVWPNLWGSQDHPLHAFNPAAWRRFKYLPFMVSAVMSLRFKHPRF